MAAKVHFYTLNRW